MESALWEYLDEGRPDDEVSVIIRFLPGQAVPSGLRVIAKYDLLVTARIVRRDIVRIRNEVASMKRPQTYSPALWDDEEADDADDLLPRPSDIRRVPGLPDGNGVVLCHLDWGLDFSHPSFRRADGTTRLLKLWDQGAPYDPAVPNRYGFGRIYSRDEINAALKSKDPLAALNYRWWVSDSGSGAHGSHTLGISGGSPVDGLPTGLAPEADLLFVDLTSHTPEGPQPLGSSTDLLEGVDFADRIAGNRPLVINASLGRQAGQHDGLTLTEQALDQFVTSRAGRAMVMSCGNYYTKRAHAQVTLQPGETRTLSLDLLPGRRKSEVDLWYPRSDRLLITVEGPSGLQAGPIGPEQRASLALAGKSVGRLYHRSDDPNNGDHQVSLFLDPHAPEGRWKLTMTGVIIGDGRAHAWVERDPTGKARLRFTEEDVDQRTTLGTICNGFSTLAVAAYDLQSPDRDPGAFSSGGPTRDGRLGRPTCGCPGVKVLSARSTPRNGKDAPLATRKSGTSMAAPFAAGATALLMQAAPRALWIDDIRALLVGTADPVPDTQRDRLGAGYLNIAAAVDAARRISPRPVNTGATLLPPLAPRAQLSLPSNMEMTMSNPLPELETDTDADCDADYDAEHDAGGESGLDQESPDDLGTRIEGEETWPDDVEASQDISADQTEANRRGGGGFGSLPFQFQIPIGGNAGGFGIAVPIGGRNSPFALSLPLGGQPPVQAPSATPPVPATPPAPVPGDPPLVTALDLPHDPVSLATQMAVETGELASDGFCEHGADCDCDHDATEQDNDAMAEALQIDRLERSYIDADYAEVDARYDGEQLMGAVNSALGSRYDQPSEMLGAIQDQMSADDLLALPDRRTKQSLYDLFRAVAGGQGSPLRLLGRSVQVIGRPGTLASQISPRRGDVMLRSALGQRFVQLSFVADPDVVPQAMLQHRGWRADSNGTPQPGQYVHVVELWPQRRGEADRFARLLADVDNLVAPGTLLLRLLPESSAPASADDAGDLDHPIIMMGAQGRAVAGLQSRLNQLHARRVAAGLQGLGNLPLAEDGRFGPALRAAIVAMQHLAPTGLIPNPTGIMDRASWQALALMERIGLGLPTAPAPDRVPTRPSADSAPGQLTVDHVVMLSAHRGTGPDLMLRWNAMPPGTERVDIVVHLHGFSGHGGAMRIDRDKMPNSGLDFANPENPAEQGRVAPTLAILPRGNYYGGATHMGYDFPALTAPGALSQLIQASLDAFRAQTGSAATAGRLILTAHSGGGAPLMRLLAQYDPDEVFAFDALYGRPDALVRWAEARLRGPNAATSALRVLFRAGEGTAPYSHAVALALRGLLDGQTGLTEHFRVEPVRVPHNDIPRRFGWRLLADPAAALVAPAPARQVSKQETAAKWPDHLADAAVEETQDAGLGQDDVNRLSASEFSNTAELERHFAPAGGFADWFNGTLSGQAPYARPGRGGALRVPTGDAARARFRTFWDNLAAAYRQPRISLLEFASLMAIVLNETDGDFAGRTESSGRGGGGRTDRNGRHPGLAYFFDRIELRAGHWKASYNHLSGGRTAASLFDDPIFVHAHQSLGGADRLARHGQDFGNAWAGSTYPVDQGFSPDENDPSTAFIREADFYKFRGRGIIQTTGRASYIRLVHAIKAYRGTDPVTRAAALAWSSVPDDDVCTASTNADWERLFAVPTTLGLAFSLHSPTYRMMSRAADTLNAVPAAGHAGARGSIYLMGRRISGSHDYGAHLYRDRVLGLLRAMLRLPLGAGSGSGATQVPAAPHPSSGSAPTPSLPRAGLEPEHPSRRRDPTPTTPASGHVRPRGPVPAPDAETAHQQWAANPGAHPFFPQGESQYLRFAPMFAQRGVADAAAYLAHSITMLTFFGRRQPGHRALAAPLAAAEAALAGHTLQPPIISFGCLNVREIAGTNRLSFHALGLAVDLNPSTNPHIRDRDEFLVIQAVTGLDLHRERTAARLREASQQFQRDFNLGWVDSQTDPQIIAALRRTGLRTRLDRFARSGFCTLDEALINALLAAGLNWGGSWSSSKDFMHFELP